MIFTSDYIPIQLSYDVCAMENFLSCANLQNHYEIYLNYVKKFNELKAANPAYSEMTPKEILSAPFSLPWQIRAEFIDIAGGIYNHEVVFNSMTPTAGSYPSKLLADEIAASFGNIDNIKKRFADADNSLVGSGYIMIVKNPSGSLNVISMPNEESSLIDGMYPILMLDIWEHAYASNFFETENYIDKWFDHVNWNTANERYGNAEL